MTYFISPLIYELCNNNYALQQFHTAFYKVCQCFAFQHIVCQKGQINQLTNLFVLVCIGFQDRFFLIGQLLNLFFQVFNLGFFCRRNFLVFFAFMIVGQCRFFFFRKGNVSCQWSNFSTASCFFISQ